MKESIFLFQKKAIWYRKKRISAFGERDSDLKLIRWLYSLSAMFQNLENKFSFTCLGLLWCSARIPQTVLIVQVQGSPLSLSLSCIGEGNGKPLQCSCLENPRDGGAWWAAVSGVAQSPTRLKWLSSSRVPYKESHIVLGWPKICLSFSVRC